MQTYILTKFMRSMIRTCHPLLQNACLLYSQRKSNMYANFVANEINKLDAKSIWLGNFSQRLIEFVIKDDSGLHYKKL